MLSKFWHGGLRVQKLLVARVKVLREVPVRGGGLIPPNQYDVPLPQRMMPGTALVNNWEVIPLFAVTGVAMVLLFFSIGWAIKNKVDVVFTTHNRRNISRTMNLRCPTTHKLIIINQRYEPWPEMQDVLDKMKQAEKKLMLRTAMCSFAPIQQVDCVYMTHSRDNISRTMDLRNPSCHKLVTINQTYEPWDEMQDALDAMVVAQRRYNVRMELAKKCYPKP